EGQEGPTGPCQSGNPTWFFAAPKLWFNAPPMTSPTIESVSHESRVFEPPDAFREGARISSRAAYAALHRQSLEDPERFWAEQADELHWFKRPTQILRWEPPFARWFEDGTTNLAFNCLDRHLDTSIANRAALIWEGEPGEVRTLTYRQLA